MASDLVERLAQRFVEEMLYTNSPNPQANKRDRQIAQFFVLAMADEVEKEWGKMTWCRLLVTWLRAQAEEE